VFLPRFFWRFAETKTEHSVVIQVWINAQSIRPGVDGRWGTGEMSYR
jgi:hypothetical protein